MFYAKIAHDVQNFIIFPRGKIHFFSQSGITGIDFAAIHSMAFHVAPENPIHNILCVATYWRILINVGFQNISYLFRSSTPYSSFCFNIRNRFTAKIAP